MNLRDWLKKEINAKDVELDALAHSIVSRVHSYEEYLLACGRYRAMRMQAESLQNEYSKRATEDDDTIEEPEEIEKPADKRNLVRQPRRWGGS